jgi:hypothetical protein
MQEGGEDVRRLTRAYCEYNGHSAGEAAYQGNEDSREPYSGLSCRRTDAEEIMAELPDLRKEQIAACLDYARALAEFEVAV